MQSNKYELEREARIAQNKKRMAELNLLFIARTTIAHAPARARARAPAPTRVRCSLPVRASARLVGAQAEHARGLGSDSETDDEGFVTPARDDPLRLGATTSGKRAIERVVSRNTSRNETWTGARMHELPPPPPGVRRNMSCHCCTQCVASWRGNMTKPLACRTCGKFYCARCLFHINGAADMQDVYNFIDDMSDEWSCFHCTGTCACQDKSLTSLYRHNSKPGYMAHKHRGWVGVNGGFAEAACKPQESLLDDSLSERRVKRKLTLDKPAPPPVVATATPPAAPVPELAVGASVRKKFGTRFFKGTVTELWQEPGEELTAHIVYEDGDEEDLGAEEARACVV